jgi:hypothetical protein
VIHRLLKVASEARIEPPIHVEIFRSGGAWIKQGPCCHAPPFDLIGTAHENESAGL